MILEYQVLHLDVKAPERANPSDAGMDVFYCPRETDNDGNAIYGNTIRLLPGQSALFGTGLKFGIPHGYMLEVKNRSGNAAKRGLIVGACCVDSGFDGEVFVDLHNIGVEPQVIAPGMKIAQLVMIPVVHFRAYECLDESLYSEPITISNRGDGSLGSTDG